MNGYNDNINQQQIDKLAQLFPEVVTEGKIDWQKLQATLGGAVDLSERYGLGWKGKSDVFTAIQEKTVQTLHLDRANSVDWDTTGNMFIEGDNLAALKILHKAYYGKVKMIYIDPPYNTGNDFIYNDDFKQTRRSYEAEAGITDDEGNVVRDDGLRTNTGGHKHSNWLNMMYPRLFLARNLLRQDGVIFVSIDDNEVHNLRLMMNEIFGEENFVNQILWLHGKGKKDTWMRTTQQYILIYARNKSELPQWCDVQYAQGIFSNPDNDPRGEWFSGSISFDEKRSNKNRDTYFTIKSPSGVEWTRQWQVEKPEDMYELIRDNRIYFGPAPEYANVPRKKIFPTDENEIIPSNLMDDVGTTRSAQAELDNIMNGKFFDNPKPTGLIKKIISISADKNSVILDFFSGSGTTAHAVAELNAEDGGNRRWICVQLPELTDEKSEVYKAGYRTIADIARERIRRAGAKIRADQADKLVSRDAPLDLGFRAYRVSDSNFKQWNELVSDPEEIRQQALANLDPLEEGATDDDLLTELLLKRGVSPLAKIEQHDNFCFIPSEKLAICLAHSMTEELFTTILAVKPSSIIFLDRAFGYDINLKANLLLQAERQGVEVEVV
mgnify:FL=1